MLISHIWREQQPTWFVVVVVLLYNSCPVCLLYFIYTFQVTSSLNSASDLPVLGYDSDSNIWKQNTMDVSKQNVNSQLATMLGLLLLFTD